MLEPSRGVTHGASVRQAHGGGHGWFVTFADLMGLLVSFFVMLVAFSNQDQKKLQIVAGSMRDAFGVQTNVRYSGIIEVDGLPTRPKLKNAAHIQPEDASATPTPDEHDRKREYGSQVSRTTRLSRLPRPRCARRCRTCRNWPRPPSTSWSRRPRRASISISSTRKAARCSRKAPRSPTSAPARIIEKLAGPLKATPYRISITGHTSASQTAAAAGLRAVEPVGRPGQRRAPDPGRAGAAVEQYL